MELDNMDFRNLFLENSQRLEVYLSAGTVPTEIIEILLDYVCVILEIERNKLPVFHLNGLPINIVKSNVTLSVQEQNKILRTIESKYGTLLWSFGRIFEEQESHLKSSDADLYNLVKRKLGHKKSASDIPVKPDIGITLADRPQFPVNRLIWFRHNFRNKLQFRWRYDRHDWRAIMDTNSVVSSKTGDQQILAQANFIWQYIKVNDDSEERKIAAEYLFERENPFMIQIMVFSETNLCSMMMFSKDAILRYQLNI